MITLVLEVLPLAIAGAISPVVLMIGLALLGGERPRVQTAFYALGVTATTGILFGLGLIAIRLQDDGLEPGVLGSPAAHLIVGVLLLAAGIGLAVVRPNPHRIEALQERLLAGHRPPRDFAVAGVAVMITNVSTFVMMIAIIHAVARAGVGVPRDGVALLVATVIIILPALAPLLVAVVGGEQRKAQLRRVGAFTTRYGRFAMAVIWIGFGLKDVLQVVLQAA